LNTSPLSGNYAKQTGRIPVFSHISEEAAKSMIIKLNRYLSRFPESLKINDITAGRKIIYEIVERIENAEYIFIYFMMLI
jgi:hypothetical protein